MSETAIQKHKIERGQYIFGEQMWQWQMTSDDKIS